MGEVVEETNPFTGAIMLRRTDTQVPTPMHDMGTFLPTEWERVPGAYFIPPAGQGGRSQGLPGACRGPDPAPGPRLEDGHTGCARDRRGRGLRHRFGDHFRAGLRRPSSPGRLGEYARETRTLEAGTIRISMDQPLARVAFTLLEPRSDDGFVAWGFLANTLQAGAAYPILRGGL